MSEVCKKLLDKINHFIKKLFQNFNIICNDPFNKYFTHFLHFSNVSNTLGSMIEIYSTVLPL